MSEPKSALIVKEKWALKLLNGEKTWEIRGSSTSKRGKIAIAISGTAWQIVWRDHPRTNPLAES